MPDTTHDPAIHIVDYNRSWPREFDREAAKLHDALGRVAVRIDHVGSTSVPGLAAKPIIDISVSVQSVYPMDDYRRPLEKLGYLFVYASGSPDFHFFGKPALRPRTHHIHVCKLGSGHEYRHLAFRNYLRAHPHEAERYAAVKRSIGAKHPGDRLAYIAGKQDIVDEIEKKSLAWANKAGWMY
ncbi:MAG: GrpB family protein [Chloroflexi bacterium]|nr:GrpB family protein [Chloroflexota bacterium]